MLPPFPVCAICLAPLKEPKELSIEMAQNERELRSILQDGGVKRDIRDFVQPLSFSPNPKTPSVYNPISASQPPDAKRPSTRAPPLSLALPPLVAHNRNEAGSPPQLSPRIAVEPSPTPHPAPTPPPPHSHTPLTLALSTPSTETNNPPHPRQSPPSPNPPKCHFLIAPSPISASQLAS